ncbi:MAG: hypothetical protein WCE64_11845 [Bacteroidales bacterium]
MYETKRQPPLTRAQFRGRLFNHFAVSLAVIVCSLILGMTGYMVFEHLSITDAFLNASMLLGGMGPVNAPVTTAGKIFAGCYALFAGLIIIATTAVMLTPVLHRVIHKYHWDEPKGSTTGTQRKPIP